MHSNILIKLSKHIPVSVASLIMKNNISHFYNTNNYNEVYRMTKELNYFEKKAFDEFFSSINIDYPKILDIGCGAGCPYDIYMIENNCQLLGVDCSRNQIKRAKKNVPLAKYKCIDFLKFSCGETYNGVVMLYSLYHFHREYHYKVLQKVYDVLEDKGKVLLNVRKEDSGNIKYKKNFCGKPMYWSYYDIETFKKILNQIGFSFKVVGDEKLYGSSESHIWLILSK